MLKFFKNLFSKKQKDPLLPGATFSMLIQLDKETGIYQIMIHEDDTSTDNAEMVATMLFDIFNSNGLRNVFAAFENYPSNDEELEFCRNTLTLWKHLAEHKINSVKKKIDPTTVFTIGGKKNE